MTASSPLLDRCDVSTEGQDVKLSQIELSLTQWASSKWTMFFARAAMLATPLLIAGFAGAWAVATSGVSSDLVKAQKKIADVATIQETRASDSEAFQTEVRGAIKGINGRLDAVDDKMFTVKVDIGVIKRLLQEARPASLPVDPSDVPPELQARVAWAPH